MDRLSIGPCQINLHPSWTMLTLFVDSLGSVCLHLSPMNMIGDAFLEFFLILYALCLLLKKSTLSLHITWMGSA
jgi:hypothetical protein